jgi:Copper amine oxidase N-terminal domain
MGLLHVLWVKVMQHRLAVQSAFACIATMLATGALASAGDFGNPPSGQVPIFYNDHTVYAKPDALQRNRVLAAFIKGHHIYVPLRSMFEEMGAVVTASGDGKTFTATKTGVIVSVTLGSNVVTINGETRPLDVPPMLYNGVILVPIRVLSEALGAYVLWVPDKQIVAIRYLPAAAASTAPILTPAPTASPISAAVVPPIAPAPVVRSAYNGFVAAAFARGKTYNEFSAGQWCPNNTFVASGAYIFQNSPFAVKVDFRQDAYVTSINQENALGAYSTQFATIDGGIATTPVFLAKQSTLDLRLEFKVASPYLYVAAGYLRTSNNYGYPSLTSFGGGLEKLPDLRARLSPYGSIFYYPNATGSYTEANVLSPNNGAAYKQSYEITKYDIGLAYSLRKFPVFLYGGYSGDSYAARQNAPIGQTHGGPYIGLGLKI